MKKKFFLINLLASIMVLSSMLFQTIHAYEHYFTEKKEQYCHHKISAGEKQITHSHSEDTKCAICSFCFSISTISTTYNLSLYTENYVRSAELFFVEMNSTFFKGSLFALRGPPDLS
ncbi:MAG TPA: hypothetical protein VF465_08415 [Flavobacterium sp.]|uniref:hypothetical protein n=1 Tax=Flavobacterium sp. TaxID=239 RepID=UPI0028EFE846|nr:hypothetical protein [uncultured Flavobacterium sp.]